ncbi:MAG: response regulator [Pseudomonadota bacterium]
MYKAQPHIVFVDDEPRVLDSFRRGFRRLKRDWSISYYTSPIEALNAMETEMFDVVVSDMRMPDMSGLEFVEAFHERSTAPCIILTGSPDLTSALYAINKADVFRFYTKPCDLELLVEGIDAALISAQLSVSQATPTDKQIGKKDGEQIGEQSQGLTTQIGLAALNRLALSVIVVDRGGHVLFTNKSAGALLSEADGLSVCPNNKCRAETADATRGLMSLIESAVDKGVSVSDETAAMALMRPSMKRPYSVFVSPLTADGASGSKTRLAALFVSDPEQQPVPTIEHIMQLHNLSRSQALLVQNLALGLRVEEAADEAGVTISTARTYLKQVFSKTDTCRQSELLKLVLASPRVTAA